MSKMKDYLNDRQYLKVSLYVAITATTLFIVFKILSNLTLILTGLRQGIGSLCAAFAPLLIGLILAYLLTPVVDIIDRKLMARVLKLKGHDPVRLERRQKLTRTLSILLTFLLIAAVLVVVLYMFTVMIMGKLVFGSLQSTTDAVIQYFLQYEDMFKSLISKIPGSGLEVKIQELANSVVNWITVHFSPDSIMGFLSGLTVIGLDFSVFIGCFAGVANIIPYFGPVLGMIPAAAIGLLTDGPVQAIVAVVVLFLIQQVDGAVISPKVVGQSIGLHPVFVLVAVTVGGYYWGILGMLLAAPVAAILKLFLVKKLDQVD